MPPNELSNWLEHYVLGIRPGDALLFIVSEEASEHELHFLNESIEEIVGDTEDVTIAVVPKRVLESVKNLSLEDLLRIRKEVDDAIVNKALLQSIGDA